MELAMKSGNFNETSIELQRKVLDTNQSIGEESYSLHAKSGVQKPGHKVNFPDGREEGSNGDLLELAIYELLVTTKVSVTQHIKILVLNCQAPNSNGDQPLQAEA